MKALKHFVFIVLTFLLFQNFLFTQVYWIQKQSPVNTWLLKCSFADTLNGWAVGAFGRVYKFNKETIGIKNGGENSPVSFNLYQNYPNPFNPLTRIYYELPENSYVRLCVYDVLGREVKSLVDGEIPRGKHESDWNASGLPSGVYFYKMEAGTYTQTKKMVLLK